MNKPLFSKGLNIDDDEAEKTSKNDKHIGTLYVYLALDANRKKSSFEKDLDSMLFGGGMVRRGKR